MDDCFVPLGHIELTSYLGINILALAYGSDALSWTQILNDSSTSIPVTNSAPPDA
jgi:hypothetical protein